METHDLVWLAGLLEGEGTFDSHEGKYPRIRVSMSDRDVVGRAATLLGARAPRLTLPARPEEKPMWHTQVVGAKAAAAMERLLPYMGARRSNKMADVLATYRRYKGDSKLTGPTMTRPPGIQRLAVAS